MLAPPRDSVVTRSTSTESASECRTTWNESQAQLVPVLHRQHCNLAGEAVEEDVLVQECPHEPEHAHEYPSDWFFGGPEGTDPRADPRFRPDTYVYLDGSLHVVHTTSSFVCDDEAIDEFTTVAGWKSGFAPVYLQVRRAGSSALDTIPWTYDRATDMVLPWK